MNQKIIFAILIASFISIQVKAQFTKAEIMATGLTCSMCSNAINKQLKSLAGVDSVEVDLNTNTFIVHVKKESSVSPRTLKEGVEKAGFFVGSMIVSMQFDNIVIPESKKVELDGAEFVILGNKTQILDGDVKAKIIDKGYVTQKEYKKLSKSFSKIPSFQSVAENEYHLIIN
jgi:copper chaperone CopZ